MEWRGICCPLWGHKMPWYTVLTRGHKRSKRVRYTQNEYYSGCLDVLTKCSQDFPRGEDATWLEKSRIVKNLKKDAKKDHSYFYRFQQAEDAEQNRHSSFRNACSCIDKMATLRKVTCKPIEWNTWLYVNFNDLKEAFDDGDRNTIYRVA